MRTGRQRYEGIEIQLDDAVVNGVVIGGEGNEIFFPALRFQKGSRHFVRREDGGRCPQLRAHIGDGGPLRHGKVGDGGAAPFNNTADAAFDRKDLQQFQTHILGGNVWRQFAGTMHFDHFRHGDVVSAAAHGHGHIHAPGAHGQHTEAAAGGGVTVGADEGLTGNAEPLQMHLMADAVAGTGKPDPVFFRHALNVAVVIGVFKAALQGVMVDIGNAPLRFHAVDAHGFKFQIRHGSGGVLSQGLIDAETDLLPGDHFPGNEMRRDDFLSQCFRHLFSPPFPKYFRRRGAGAHR